MPARLLIPFPMVAAFTEEFGVQGVVGVRAIAYCAGSFYSPVYGHCQWRRGLQTASCALGCQVVPNERHMGCGFHAYWDLGDAQEFANQIRGAANCLVLVECFGRVVVHERGLRAEQARVVAVLDWDPGLVHDANAERGPGLISVPLAATRQFRVPLIDQFVARDVIAIQRARCEAG